MAANVFHLLGQLLERPLQWAWVVSGPTQCLLCMLLSAADVWLYLLCIPGYKPVSSRPQWQSRPLRGGDSGAGAEGHQGAIHPEAAQSCVWRVCRKFSSSRINANSVNIGLRLWPSVCSLLFLSAGESCAITQRCQTCLLPPSVTGVFGFRSEALKGLDLSDKVASQAATELWRCLSLPPTRSSIQQHTLLDK